MRTQQCYTIFYLAFILISFTSNRRKRTVCAVHSIFHFVFSFFFSKHQDSRHGCSKSFCSFFVHRATHAASMKEKKKEIYILRSLNAFVDVIVGTRGYKYVRCHILCTSECKVSPVSLKKKTKNKYGSYFLTHRLVIFVFLLLSVTVCVQKKYGSLCRTCGTVECHAM